MWYIYRKCENTLVYLSGMSSIPPSLENSQWHLNSQKMGSDPLYSIHIIAKELPGYVHKLDTISDFICIFAMPQFIDMVNVILKDEVITFGYDTTFSLFRI